MDSKRLPEAPAGFVAPHDPMYNPAPPPPPYSATGPPTGYNPPGGPISSPPMPGQMPMPYPTGAPVAPPPVGVNPGDGPLGYLAAVDQLIIKQEIHLAEVVTNIQTNTKFDILNSQGQLVYRAEEQNDYCTRNCQGAARGFTIYIKDLMGSDIIALKRDCRCCGCCFPCCCLQEMIVEAPPGYPVGTIKENWSLCSPSFTILDERGEPTYGIKSVCCPGACSVGSDVNFKVMDLTSGHEIGVVSKEWGGVIQEMYTRATNFNVTFPMHLAVQHKAILLSTAFLLNFMFFQRVPVQHQNHDHDHHHHHSSGLSAGIATGLASGLSSGLSSSHHHHVGTTTTTFS